MTSFPPSRPGSDPDKRKACQRPWRQEDGCPAGIRSPSAWRDSGLFHQKASSPGRIITELSRGQLPCARDLLAFPGESPASLPGPRGSLLAFGSGRLVPAGSRSRTPLTSSFPAPPLSDVPLLPLGVRPGAFMPAIGVRPRLVISLGFGLPSSTGSAQILIYLSVA